jgi:hypothetical protein
MVIPTHMTTVRDAGTLKNTENASQQNVVNDIFNKLARTFTAQMAEPDNCRTANIEIPTER